MSEGVFESIPEVISCLRTDLTVRGQNRMSVEKFGSHTDMPCYTAHFGRDSPCPGCMVDEVLERGRGGHWFLTDERDDKTSYYEITVAPVLDGEGKVVELVEVIRDATMTLALEQHLIRNSEQLEAEVERRAEELAGLTSRTRELRGELEALRKDQAALVQTEKMASVGRLAAGLTHEIHTPLGALMSNLDMLQRCQLRADEQLASASAPAGEKLAELEKVVRMCRELLELQRLAAERIHKIVHSLRNFAHLDRAVEEPYDVHEGIDAALALLNHEMKGRIEVVRQYGKLPPVVCKPDAVNQVFMNLLQNATHAIEQQGRIGIRTWVEGDDALLEFEDSGKGIPAENQAKIFEPGFTTKPRGVGTGLGLAIAFGTMRDHGGEITLESAPGRTVFTLRLPLRGKSA